MLVFAIITGLVLFEVALQSTNVYSLLTYSKENSLL